MALNPINTYKYFGSAGTEPNRKIDFIRSSENPKELTAIHSVFDNAVWRPTSTLPAQEIEVEMISKSMRHQILQDIISKKKAGQPVDIPKLNEYKKMSELSIENQDAILKNLEPIGPWRIEITNGFSEDAKFEKVVFLSFFNPS